MTRLVYKWHKWLAVTAGLATLLWFVSGVVMILPANLLVKPLATVERNENAPSFNEIRVSIPQAIETASVHGGGNITVTGVTTKRILNRICYRISPATSGTHLIDAMDGTRFVIDAATARQIAIAAGADPNTAGESMLVGKFFDPDYLYGPLPAFKIAGNDGRGTMYFVTVEDGEVRSTNRMGRVRGFLAGLHTFDFLRPVAGGRVVRGLMLLFALVGTAMSLFGGWILWMQFRNWRQMRRQSA